MAADDLTVELDRIAERSAAALEFPMSGFAEDSIRACTQSATDVPRLVAAVEAVLKAADGWNSLWPCATQVREAIAREITGKGEGDGA